MRKPLALVAVVGLLALSGCSASPGAAYVAAVKEDAPEVLERGNTAELVELGEKICNGFDDGRSAYEMGDWFTEIGWSLAEAGTVVVKAAQVLCPEHADKVD